MSADNYLYVTKRGDKFVGVMLFASSDYAQSDIDKLRTIVEAFTLNDALRLAHREVERTFYEYGVSLEHGLTNNEPVDGNTPVLHGALAPPKSDFSGGSGKADQT